MSMQHPANGFGSAGFQMKFRKREVVGQAVPQRRGRQCRDERVPERTADHGPNKNRAFRYFLGSAEVSPHAESMIWRQSSNGEKKSQQEKKSKYGGSIESGQSYQPKGCTPTSKSQCHRKQRVVIRMNQCVAHDAAYESSQS